MEMTLTESMIILRLLTEALVEAEERESKVRKTGEELTALPQLASEVSRYGREHLQRY